MNLQLQDRLALVTGSTGGIGKQIAAELAREGARVLVNGRSREAVERAVAELQQHGTVEGVAADAGTEAGVDSLISAIKRRGSLEILVNNVSIYAAGPFEQLGDEEWQRCFDINVMSGVRLCRAFLDDMRSRRWGRVVFISSDTGRDADETMIPFSMTNTAQLALARGLAQYLRESGVTVNSVLPDASLEQANRRAAELQPAQGSGAYLRANFGIDNRPSVLKGQFTSSREAARFVAFLCSPFAAGISGTVWNNGSRYA